MYLLGIDLGSSSVKVALLDAKSGKIIAQVSSPSTEMSMYAAQAGWAEQDPENWWYHITIACKTVLGKNDTDTSKIIGIGIAYQMHGLVVVDKNQQVLRPSIIWCDSRATAIGNNALDTLGEKFCLSRYLNSPGNFTASKLKWVKENEPDIYAQIYKAMLPGDYVAMRMTGEIRTTVSGLSEGVLWDFQQHQIASDLLDHYGLSELLLPELVETFGAQGKLTKVAAKQLGLVEGIPLGYRAGDQPNNALSLGVINPNQVAATGGTSGVVYGIVNKAVTDPKSRINGFAHVNHQQAEPRIGILLCINGAGSQYAWIKEQIATEGMTYPDIERALAAISIGADGLRWFPFGNGAERILENNYQGAQLFNLQLQRHGKSHLYRAALEGIAFAFVYGLEILNAMGIYPKTIRVGNDNLFQSDVFSSTIATLANIKIEMINSTGAIGAAKGAGFGVGVYKSLEEAIGELDILHSYMPETNDFSQYEKAYTDWKSILEKQYKIVN